MDIAPVDLRTALIVTAECARAALEARETPTRDTVAARRAAFTQHVATARAAGPTSPAGQAALAHALALVPLLLAETLHAVAPGAAEAFAVLDALTEAIEVAQA